MVIRSIFRLVPRVCRLSFMLGLATLLFSLEAVALDSDSLSFTLVPHTAESSRNDVPNSDDSEPEHGSTRSRTGKKVDVKAYGAVADGLTDDTAAFNAALKELAGAGGGVCLVPKGTYIISASGITAPYKPAVTSNVRFVGEGRGESILKVNAMPSNHLLQCDGDNWSVENLTFDMGDYTPKVRFAAIACKGNSWRVSRCAIIKSGRLGIAASGGSNWSIEGNYINRMVPGARPGIGGILITSSAPGAWSSHGRVAGNICEGAGMTITGSNTTVARNRVNRSGSGSGMFVQGSPSTHSPTITGNVCTGGLSGYEESGKWWSVNGFEIWAPDSVICDNIAHDNDGGGIAIGGQNSIVIGNQAYNNGRGRAGSAGFVARVNLARGTSASHSIFIANQAYDTRYPSHNATQDFGYVEQAAAVIDVKQFANDYNHNRVGPTKVYAQQANVMRTPISPEMKNNLKALADATDLPDSARRAVRECLAR